MKSFSYIFIISICITILDSVLSTSKSHSKNDKKYDEYLIYQSKSVSPFYEKGAKSALLKQSFSNQSNPFIPSPSSLKRKSKVNPKYAPYSAYSSKITKKLNSLTKDQKLNLAAKKMERQIKKLSQKANEKEKMLFIHKLKNSNNIKLEQQQPDDIHHFPQNQPSSESSTSES